MICLASASLLGLGAQGRMCTVGTLAAVDRDALRRRYPDHADLPRAGPPGGASAQLGRAGQALAAGPARRDAGSFVNAGLLRSIVLLVLLGRTLRIRRPA